MLRDASIGNHAVQPPRRCDDLFQTLRDCIGVGDVHDQVGESPWELCTEIMEDLRWPPNVEGPDMGGAILEADLGEGEADALVCAADLMEKVRKESMD